MTEVKELKRRVRDIIEPGRNLGHVDGKQAKEVVESSTDVVVETVIAASVASGNDDRINFVEEEKPRQNGERGSCDDCQ